MFVIRSEITKFRGFLKCSISRGPHDCPRMSYFHLTCHTFSDLLEEDHTVMDIATAAATLVGQGNMDPAAMAAFLQRRNLPPPSKQHKLQFSEQTTNDH